MTTATYPEKLQILTLVPDKWSRQHCAQYFNVSEYLVRQARELKKSGGILTKPNPKRGKTLPNETLNLVRCFYEDDEYSRQMPGKKDCVSIGKGEYKQKRLILCNLKELHAAFKEKNPNTKIGFSKFCSLRPKWCVVAGAKGTHSVCVCSAHQNAVLLVEAIDWDYTYKDLMGKIVCSLEDRECMMHRCENCPGTDALRKLLEDEFSEKDKEDEFHYSQWDTTDRATLSTITTTYDEYKEALITMIDDLTKHSYLAKCQAKFLKAKKEELSANEGIVLGDFAENYQFLIQDEIQSYHWSKEYCTLHPLVLYFRGPSGNIEHESFCFISDDNTHDTSFVYKLQTIFLEHLKLKHPNIDKLYYFSDGCGGQYKNYKNFMNLCMHEHDFNIKAEWVFFATSHGKSPCDGIGGAVKRHVAKRSLQRPINDQILDYKSMLELCEKEMTSINFFEIVKEEMVKVRSDLEVRYRNGDTVPGTRASHHFIPLSSAKVAHKLTSEDEAYIDIHNFNVPTIFRITDLTPSTYITCIYNSFWWVGLITKVNLQEGDVQVDFMHPHGPRKSFNWPRHSDTCFVPIKNIILKIAAPATTTGRTYTITNDEYNETVTKFSSI